MQLANATVALAGDTGNTVQKFEVTPAEVAVLQLIHGNDAVTEITVLEEETDRNSRAERQRLSETYGAQEGETFRSRAVDALFPGAAARLFETFDELELDESLYARKAERAPAPKKATASKAKAAPKGKAKAAEEEPAEQDEGEDDGIEDMPPSNDVMG